MISVSCPQCGQLYNLKDEFGGKRVRCSKCNATNTVPSSASPAADDFAAGPDGVQPVSQPQEDWPGPAQGQPFSPPPFGGSASGRTEESPVSQRMTQALRATRPWVLFLGILGLISSGFMVIGGLLFMVVAGTRRGGPEPALGLLYMGMGALYFVPACYLFRYGTRIKQFLQTGTTAFAESALEVQKSFWKFVGILSILVIIIYIVVIVLVIGLVLSR